MSESFYGGRRGASIIISGSYNTVTDMENDFQLSNCKVGYDEYATVDETIGNNTTTKLYRRTLSGPLYAGVLSAGAAGGNSQSGSAGSLNLILSTFDSIPQGENSGNGEYNIDNNSLVPGQFTDENGNPLYNDSIKWRYCNIIDSLGNNSTTYIGFTIPYTIFDFSASFVDDVNVEDIITKDNTFNEHPFYQKWNLKIPRGIKGDSISNLRLMSAITARQENIIFANGYIITDDDINNNIQYLIYDQINSTTNKIEIYYLGNYSMVEEVQFIDDGTITFEFNNGKQNNFPKLVKWINNFSIAENGQLSIEYNTGETQIFEDAIYSITDITIDEDGNFVIHDNQGGSVIYPIQYPMTIKLDSGEEEGQGTQQIIATYNNGDSEAISPPINYIMRTAIDDNYHLLFLYSDPARRAAIENPVTYDGINLWEDMGSVKNDNGLFIGKHYDNLSTYSIDNAIEQINKDYPNGLEGKDKGKIITVGSYNSAKSFFAFDYDRNTWYFLGRIESIESQFIVAEETDENIVNKRNNLAIGGIWFIVSEE